MRIACLLIAIACITGIAIPVQAQTDRGELHVIVDYGDNVVHDGAVTLYRVADPCGNDYVLTDSFGGGLVKREDTESAALAAWLAESARTEGLSRILDADGWACFTGLPNGLYMIKQSQFEQEDIPFAPILVTVPCNGSWNIGVYPLEGEIFTESPKTGQHMSPLIGAMGIVFSATALGMCIDHIKRK